MAERIALISTATTYTASSGAVFFGAFTANELAAVGGLTLGLLTFGVNFYFKHKHYQLALAELKQKQQDNEEHF